MKVHQVIAAFAAAGATTEELAGLTEAFEDIFNRKLSIMYLEEDGKKFLSFQDPQQAFPSWSEERKAGKLFREVGRVEVEAFPQRGTVEADLQHARAWQFVRTGQ